MTRSRSSRGRNRSRAGRAAPAAVQDAVTGQVESETVTLTPSDPAPQSAEPNGQDGERTASQPGRPAGKRSPRSGAPGRAPRQGMENGSRGRNAPGQGRNQRRRQQRGPRPAASPNEVLKPKAPVALTLRPIEKRRVDEFADENGPLFGCPMLTRTRIALPVSANHQAPRCSLGWALHSEDEALLCMYTEDVPSCWKAHPENVEKIRSKLLERETAAD